MFAFVLYDAGAACRELDEEFLFLARDRMGIKPLYYSFNEKSEVLSFASEVKALIRSGAVPDAIDRNALIAFLCLGSVPFPLTWQRNVICLPPAHFFAVSRKGVRTGTYWQLDEPGDDENGNLRTILDDAVRRHLAADVPVGVFLSDGVDSSAVAALAARHHTSPVSTLTVSFAEREFDEAANSRQFASKIGTEHHEVRVSSADFISEIPNFLNSLDQPTADGVNTYFVCRAAKQQGLKVVLSGLGGDEVFLGYSHYQHLLRRGAVLGTYASLPMPIRGAIARWGTFYGSVLGADRWKRLQYCTGRTASEGLYLLLRGFFPRDRVATLTGASMSEVDAALDAAFSPIRTLTRSSDPHAALFQRMELRRYMHDQLLRDSDVFSMAHSVELRVPLLDDAVMQASFRIPMREKISRKLNKPKLVECLPNGMLTPMSKRSKRGFTFPFKYWMRDQGSELEAQATQGNLLDRGAVRQCWTDFRSGRVHWSRAWSTVVLNSLVQ
jgi:asparagine synthase (glutamine-hydrolysing)